MLRLSEMRRFLQSSSSWERDVFWLAEHLKRETEMFSSLPYCDVRWDKQ